MRAPGPGPRRRAAAIVRLFRGLLLLVLVAAAGWSLCVAAIHVWGRRDEARPADAIVVLGAAQYDGRPSPVLRARLDHAIRLYGDGVAPTLIVTGGQAAGDTVSEAIVARRYAARMGVPETAILTEPGAGRTTLESVEAVARLMRDRELQSAVLVSDPFHMLRLKLLARAAGFRGFTSPTRSSPISLSRREERRHVLRESISLPIALARAIL
jgi:uncharacterized SAM-binding protein YcdF (DUF218 family)